jgi:DNA-binding beta-propeller fold protein YncE
MKKYILSIFALLALAAPKTTHAQTYVLDKTIALPGDAGWDYLSIDKVNSKLYVSHGNSVNVVDTKTDQPVGVIANLQGIHGIAIDNKANRGFISDGRANAVVAFDLTTLATLATIPVTATGPDCIIYDPYSDRVFSFNGESNNSSVVDPNALKQVGTVDLGGGPEFAASDGNGKIYNNLEDKNSLDVIDVKTLKVVANYPLAPGGGPTGLAMDIANGRTFSGCRENKGMTVINVSTGKVVTTLPIGAGVDAVAFDPETKLIFCSCGDGTVTIIKELTPDSYSVIQTLQTQAGARTMALDLKTHKIYLSVAERVAGTRKSLPGTFKLLVYKPQ